MKLPRDTGPAAYSPVIQINYSGLGAKAYQIKVWLLAPGPVSWPHASNQWNERVFAIDNSAGGHVSGVITVVESMDVLGYDAFAWVVRLFESGTGHEVASAEHLTSATLNRPPVLAGIGSRTVARGDTMTFTVAASDADSGTAPTLSATHLPVGATFAPGSGVFMWTPDTAGVHEGAIFTATDSGDGALSDSERVTFTVLDKPHIVFQPRPLFLTPGQSGTLNVTADAESSAGTIQHQWSKDGVPLPGETASSLTLSNVTTAAAGIYRVVATNTAGSTTSQEAFVVVALPRTLEETRHGLLEYLKAVQDQYHLCVDVYRDADSPGNHFHARGFIPDENARVTMDGACTLSPQEGATCMKFTFADDGTGINGGGIYLMNGALINNAPRPYFGESELTVGGQTYTFVDTAAATTTLTRSHHGMNLTGATKLVFHVRGGAGGEQVEFFFGGVGRFPFSQPHPDSVDRHPAQGTRTVLSTAWQRCEIDLTGLDLSDIKGGLGWYAETIHNAGGQITFYLDNVCFELSPEAQAARLATPHLLRSFSTLAVQPPWSPDQDLPFDLAFRGAAQIYDQSIAIFAFLSEGSADSLRRARIIADGLVYAIHHHRDPFLPGTSRLRGFTRLYRAGDIGLPPGWEINGRAATIPAAGVYHDPTQSFTELAESSLVDTGDNLWCIMALLATYEVTREPSYLATAIVVAENLVEADGPYAIRSTMEPYRGFYGGIEQVGSATPVRRTYRSVEHHLDAVVAFRRLHQFTLETRWLGHADNARAFIEMMWREDIGGYLAGTSSEPNPVPNTTPGQLPEDTQSWTALALDDVATLHPTILSCLDTNHSYGVSGYQMFDFANDRDGFWSEAQGHVALAHYKYLHRAHSAYLLSVLPLLQQMPPPYGDGRGIVAASRDDVTSGFGFFWFRRMHISATGWALMGLQRYNPFAARSMLSVPVLIPGGLPTPATFRFTLHGERGEVYRIETSTDLVAWTPVEVVQLAQDQDLLMKDYSMQPPAVRRFYRAVHLANAP
ncbi:MAG: immunoglobulin domain-containing protein [Prosthecobacter sp.]